MNLRIHGRAPVRAAHVALVALFLPALALGGCQSGPRPADGVAGATSGGHGWKPARPDTLGPVVAVVGNRRITDHDVDSLVASAPENMRDQFNTADAYRRLVDRLVTEEAVYQAARAAGADKDPEYRAELARAARELLIRGYYTTRMGAAPQPQESEIQTYYDAHKEDYVVQPRARVRHIQFATRAKAASVRRLLEKGGLWDALCRTHSTDAATKNDGGIVGFVTPEIEYVPGIGKAPSIVTAAFELKEGETSQPLKSDKGWHLIRVESVEPKSYQPLAAVRQGIVDRLGTEQSGVFSKALLDSLKEQANAAIFDDSIAVAVRPMKTPQDYFREAQAAVSPQNRIELYRALVSRFPNDSVTVQAEFMIGFTYAEDIGDTEQARDEFVKFIARHPNHELATSAKWMMENMDKPAPDLEGGDSGDAGSRGAATDSTRTAPPQKTQGSP